MKVLVATRVSQGRDRRDYCFCVEGELVTAAVFECSSPGCGCDRGFGGLASHRATTTAEVVDLDISAAAFRDAVRASLADQGWIGDDDDADDDDADEELVDEHVRSVMAVCAHFPTGSIVRRHGAQVSALPMAA